MSGTRITYFGQPTNYSNNGQNFKGRISKSGDQYILDPYMLGYGTQHFTKNDGLIYTYDGQGNEIVAPDQNYWRLTFEQAKQNAQPNMAQKIAHKIGSGISSFAPKTSQWLLNRKNGGWLYKFDNGGEAPDASLFTMDDAQQDVESPQIDMDSVVQMLQEDPEGTVSKLMSSEEGQQIIDQLKQDEQIGPFIDQVLQKLGIMREGGRMKKAECGCKATLKRMGGKIVNVDSCTGKIIK